MTWFLEKWSFTSVENWIYVEVKWWIDAVAKWFQYDILGKTWALKIRVW